MFLIGKMCVAGSEIAMSDKDPRDRDFWMFMGLWWLLAAEEEEERKKQEEEEN